MLTNSLETYEDELERCTKKIKVLNRQGLINDREKNIIIDCVEDRVKNVRKVVSNIKEW